VICFVFHPTPFFLSFFLSPHGSNTFWSSCFSFFGNRYEFLKENQTCILDLEDSMGWDLAAKMLRQRALYLEEEDGTLNTAIAVFGNSNAPPR
jgi:hypothetical protein